MASSVTIEGEKYSLTDNPKHGVIKKIKNRQKQLIVLFFEKYKDTVDKIVKEDSESSVESIIGTILAENPSEMVEYSESCENLDILATISLATNHLWTDDVIDELSAKELKITYDKCYKVLGGGFSDFLGNYQIISIPELKQEK